MKTLAILPVKSFGAAKQRLADALGAGSRQSARSGDVRRRARARAARARTRRDRGRDVRPSGGVGGRGSRGAGARAPRGGARRATRRPPCSASATRSLTDYDRVLLVPGDTPLVQAAELAALLAGATGVVVVPDRHGTGTNALVLVAARRDRAELRAGQPRAPRGRGRGGGRSIPRRGGSRPRARRGHTRTTSRSSLSAELELRRGPAPATRGALRQLDRAGAQPLRLPACPR